MILIVRIVRCKVLIKEIDDGNVNKKYTMPNALSQYPQIHSTRLLVCL